MSIEATTWALGSKVGDARRKLILFAYANHAHKDGTSAWVSKKSIAADYAECDSKTVTRHVKALIADGWIREGDQAAVAHIRADRRPVVYDLAMNEATRADWAAEHARGVKTTPRRGDSLTGRNSVHGGTSETSRGDTAVSPKPNTNQIPLTPTAPRRGPVPEPRTPLVAVKLDCPKHRAKPGDNCRLCGTTPRQIANADRLRTFNERRRADAERLAAEQAKLEQLRVDTASPKGRELVARARKAAGGAR